MPSGVEHSSVVADPSGGVSGLLEVNATSERKIRGGATNQSGLPEAAQPSSKADEQISWAAAKAELKEEFILSEAWLEELHEEIMTIEGQVDAHPGLMADLDIGSLQGEGWSIALVTELNDASLSEVELQDAMFLTNEVKNTLEVLSKDAQGLYQDAMLQYWANDMGFRVRENRDGGGEIPWSYYKAKGGVLHFSTEALAGGWKIGINFDSSDFPVFNEVLLEANRLKTELYLEIHALAYN